MNLWIDEYVMSFDSLHGAPGIPLSFSIKYTNKFNIINN